MNTIKKLEVIGFKSFYNRKELTFPPHMNVIMGPNGSGKSNVGDAICFALGKASKREMRAEKMGDLVYNGSKKLPPAKFAKVTIYIDNKNRKIPVDSDEIKISRKVDKKGLSIYKINGQRQPRDYIKSILYPAGIDPDGYNIVMQGEIEKFISLSPDERRKIIEELSGISIYEEKKHKSLLELEKVQKRLNEAKIVLTEKIKYMEELKKEKEQAEKKITVQKEYEQKRAEKIYKEMREIDAVRETFQKQFDKKESEISEKVEKRNKALVEISDENRNLELLNEEINKKGGEEQVDLAREIEGIRNRANELRAIIKSEENEIKRIGERIVQLETDLETNSSKQDELIKKSGDIKTSYELQIEELRKHEDRFQKLNNVDRERIELMSKIHNIENEMLKIKEDIAKYHQLQFDLDKKGDTEEKLKKLKRDLEKKLDDSSKFSRELGENETLKQNILKEMHLLEGKREAMLRFLDQGTKSIMSAKDKGTIKGIHGIVSELGKADTKYSLPLKVAAGSRGNAVIVDNVEVAKECIEYLRSNELGMATFLPLDKIKGSEPAEGKTENSGFVDYAINLVKFSSKYKEVFNYVFGDTIIVDSMDSAKRIGINKYRMVTLKGDLIDKSGSIQGGYRKKEGIGFKEEPIEEQLDKLKTRLASAESEISRIEPMVENISDEIALIRGRAYEYEQQLNDYDKIDLSEVEKLKEKLQDKEIEHKRAWEEMKDLPKKVAKETLAALNERIQKQREKIAEVNGQKQGTEVEMQILERDVNRANDLIKGLEKERLKFEKSREQNEKEFVGSEKRLEKKLEEEKKFHGKLEALYEKRNKLMEKIKAEEIKKGKIETEIDAIRSQSQEIQVKLAETKAKLEGKKAALDEFKHVEIKHVKETIEELSRQILELEHKLEAYGPVNMLALDAYNEVEKEYGELKIKTDKLIEERDEIMRMMDEIESQKAETFMKTFNNVSKNFERVFAVLSINGEGRIILENPEHPFEAGVDIIARPGGKKVISLRSMSGGEKTLTTLAFIFAVQEYQPSPFYIMDEVDAALDKENSERLGMLVSEYAKTSQFILITHNDSVISQADNVYGVSMTPLGESGIVNVKLPEK